MKVETPNSFTPRVRNTHKSTKNIQRNKNNWQEPIIMNGNMIYLHTSDENNSHATDMKFLILTNISDFNSVSTSTIRMRMIMLCFHIAVNLVLQNSDVIWILYHLGICKLDYDDVKETFWVLTSAKFDSEISHVNENT